MPGVYREKECPTCGIKHRKKGPFCSRSCGNGREFTEEQRKNLKVKTREYYQSPEGIATVKKNIAINMGERSPGITEEEWAVAIPELHDLRDYDDFIGGYDRGEKW